MTTALVASVPAATKELGQKSVIVNQELFNQILALHAKKGVEDPAKYFE